MASLIVKITNGTEIRRHTARVDELSFNALHTRAAAAFNMPVFALQYRDDENDDITMSCEDEMAEAVQVWHTRS